MLIFAWRSSFRPSLLDRGDQLLQGTGRLGFGTVVAGPPPRATLARASIGPPLLSMRVFSPFFAPFLPFSFSSSSSLPWSSASTTGLSSAPSPLPLPPWNTRPRMYLAVRLGTVPSTFFASSPISSDTGKTPRPYHRQLKDRKVPKKSSKAGVPGSGGLNGDLVPPSTLPQDLKGRRRRRATPFRVDNFFPSSKDNLITVDVEGELQKLVTTMDRVDKSRISQLLNAASTSQDKEYLKSIKIVENPAGRTSDQRLLSLSRVKEVVAAKRTQTQVLLGLPSNTEERHDGTTPTRGRSTNSNDYDHDHDHDHPIGNLNKNKSTVEQSTIPGLVRIPSKDKSSVSLLDLISADNEHAAVVLPARLVAAGKSRKMKGQTEANLSVVANKFGSLLVAAYKQTQSDVSAALHSTYKTIPRSKDGEISVPPSVLSNPKVAQSLRTLTKVFNEFEARAPMTSTHYTMIMMTYQRLGMPRLAAETFDRLRKSDDAVADTVAFNVMLDVLAKHGKVLECCRLFEEMKRIRGKESLPDNYTYSIVIAALGKINDKSGAVSVFRQMKKARISPNAWTWTAVIDVVGKSGDIKLALSLFQEMKASGIRADNEVYRSLIQSSAKEGESHLALTLVNQMIADDLQVDHHIFRILIQKLGEAALVKESVKMHDRLRSGYFGKRCQPTALTYNALLEVMADPHSYGVSKMTEQMITSGVLVYKQALAEKVFPEPYVKKGDTGVLDLRLYNNGSVFFVIHHFLASLVELQKTGKGGPVTRLPPFNETENDSSGDGGSDAPYGWTGRGGDHLKETYGPSKVGIPKRGVLVITGTSVKPQWSSAPQPLMTAKQYNRMAAAGTGSEVADNGGGRSGSEVHDGPTNGFEGPVVVNLSGLDVVEYDTMTRKVAGVATAGRSHIGNSSSPSISGDSGLGTKVASAATSDGEVADDKEKKASSLRARIESIFRTIRPLLHYNYDMNQPGALVLTQNILKYWAVERCKRLNNASEFTRGMRIDSKGGASSPALEEPRGILEWDPEEETKKGNNGISEFLGSGIRGSKKHSNRAGGPSQEYASSRSKLRRSR